MVYIVDITTATKAQNNNDKQQEQEQQTTTKKKKRSINPKSSHLIENPSHEKGKRIKA